MAPASLIEIQSSTLTVVEQSDLATHEATIARGLQTFYDVGAALFAIREGRLYRRTHSTFEDYCRERWGMTRMRASQLIGAAEVVANVNHGLQPPPTNERQARELSPLPPDAQIHAWAATSEILADEPITAARVREVVDVTRDLIAEGVPAEELRDAIKERVAHVAHNSGNNEWYTPTPFIEAARETMGGIDCDPASSEIANTTVKADRFFTKDDNGLKQETWGARVWMNPPYSQPLIGEFADELVRRFDAGDVREACVLVNNATETVWFQTMLAASSAVCFLRGRVKFLDPEGNPSGAPLQGQAVLYLGDDPAHFGEAFGEHGIVLYAR